MILEWGTVPLLCLDTLGWISPILQVLFRQHPYCLNFPNPKFTISSAFGHLLFHTNQSHAAWTLLPPVDASAFCLQREQNKKENFSAAGSYCCEFGPSGMPFPILQPLRLFFGDVPPVKSPQTIWRAKSHSQHKIWNIDLGVFPLPHFLWTEKHQHFTVSLLGISAWSIKDLALKVQELHWGEEKFSCHERAQTRDFPA